jgi:hypothetical protein
MAASLEDIKRVVEGRVDRVSLRGKGMASFLFAEHQGRAVELSWNRSEWWIEFWERSQDDDAAPVREQIAHSDASALKALTEWLLGRDDGTDSGSENGTSLIS